MKNTGFVWSALICFLILSCSFAKIASAVESINVQTFNPSTSSRFVFLEDGFKTEFPNPAKIFFGANYNYVDTPFVATDINQSSKTFNIINSIQTLDLMLGFRATSGFGLFVGLPIHYVTYPDNAIAPLNTGTSTAAGDLKLMAKIRLTTEESATAIALIPEFHLPTGSAVDFVSDASTYVGARLAIEHPFDNFTLLGNLGFVQASNARYANTFGPTIDYTKRFNFGIGGYMPLSNEWGLNLEFNSFHVIPFDKNLNPNELYFGFRNAATESFSWTLGTSIGKIGGAGSVNFRLIAGLRYAIYEDPKALK